MSAQLVEIECPGCGNRVSLGQNECEWCHGPIVISTFNSVYSMSMPQVNKYAGGYKKAIMEHPDNQSLNNSIAMCFLKLKMYDKALPAFEKAMEDNFDNSETFFYAAVCLLQGKKAFLHQRPTINKILEYINAAIMIEPRGIYYYFMAYIKQDYFERKCLNISPNYKDAYNQAVSAGLPEADVAFLYEVLGVERPDCL